MDAREFYDKVEADSNLTWIGGKEEPDPANDYVLVNVKVNGSKWRVPIQEIIKHDWQEWEDIFYGRRNARVMSQVTRIVGYYSFLHAWNKSKIAELMDRHKGNYTLPETREMKSDSFEDEGGTRVRYDDDGPPDKGEDTDADTDTEEEKPKRRRRRSRKS